MRIEKIYAAGARIEKLTVYIFCLQKVKNSIKLRNIVSLDSWQWSKIEERLTFVYRREYLEERNQVTDFIYFIICFGASVVGAVCGIGGGVIIKPVIDAFGVMDVSTISFLSGCTVLAMSTYSVIKGQISGASGFQKQTGIPLASGAALGGMIGKWIFSYVEKMSSDLSMVGVIQSFCLLVVTIGTLFYTIRKKHIKTKQIENVWLCSSIGLILGGTSSFLGIGGGPINLVVLYYFFSMSTKTAAENSLYIIFFSQITSLISTVAAGSIPYFHIRMLILMAGGGILGGISGRYWNDRIEARTVNRLFIALLVLLISINMYNIYIFLQ